MAFVLPRLEYLTGIEQAVWMPSRYLIMNRHYNHNTNTEDAGDQSTSTSYAPCNVHSDVSRVEGEHNAKGQLSRQTQAPKVSKIQHWLQDSSPALEGNIISHCFDSIRSALSNAARYLAQGKTDQFLDSYTGKLRREAERLHLWGSGCLFKGNDIGVSILLSTDLGIPVLCRLYELGTVTKECLLPSIHIQQSAAFPVLELERDNLQLKLEPILKILQENNQEVIDYSLPNSTKDTSNLLGPLDDIHVLIDCLMDLSLATEDFLEISNGSLPQGQYQKELNDPITQEDKQSTSESRASSSHEKQNEEAEL